MTDETWIPAEACTLPTAERPLRAAEFAELFAVFLRGADRVSPTRLRLTLAAEAEAGARDLAARETGCCSFFTFGFGPGADGTVLMDIEVPAAHVAVLDGLAAPAAP